MGTAIAGSSNPAHPRPQHLVINASVRRTSADTYLYLLVVVGSRCVESLAMGNEIAGLVRPALPARPGVAIGSVAA